MPILTLDVSDAVAEQLRRDAESRDLTVGAYLAVLVENTCGGGWPTGYPHGAFGSCPDFTVPDEPPYVPIPPLDEPNGHGA